MKTFETRSKLRKRLLDRDAGAEIVEMALIVPMLLTLLVGVFWAGRAYNIYETATRAAREGARTAVVRSCAACSPANATQSNTAVRSAVTNSLAASGIDSTQVETPTSTSCPTGATCDCPANDVCIMRDIPLNSSLPTEFGVSVSFRFPFQFNLPFTSVNMTTVHIPVLVQMREEN